MERQLFTESKQLLQADVKLWFSVLSYNVDSEHNRCNQPGALCQDNYQVFFYEAINHPAYI